MLKNLIIIIFCLFLVGCSKIGVQIRHHCSLDAMFNTKDCITYPRIKKEK